MASTAIDTYGTSKEGDGGDVYEQEYGPWSQGPLARPLPIHQVIQGFQVQHMLSEPINVLQGPGEPTETLDIGGLLYYFSLLEILLEKEKNSRSESASHPLIAEHTRVIRETIEISNPGENIADVLAATHFPSLYPLAAAAVANVAQYEKADFAPTPREYLAVFTSLHQTVSMVQLLSGDTKLDTHKYVAHQLALLYQCLNQGRSYCEKYKKRVEAKFDEVKKLTESGPKPALNDKQKKWLKEICSDVYRDYCGFPNPLLRKADRVIRCFTPAE